MENKNKNLKLTNLLVIVSKNREIYNSWYYRLKDETDLIELPEEEKLYRGTPIAITKDSINKENAQKFIDYLKTESSHEVFKKWGWK